MLLINEINMFFVGQHLTRITEMFTCQNLDGHIGYPGNTAALILHAVNKRSRWAEGCVRAQ